MPSPKSLASNNPPSEVTGLKGKRKRRIPKNANPLFTQWLTEWKQEAVEKGWKSAHTYSKALKSLKMFPLPLSSGKDCKLLQNFGDKICKMLDEKLAEYKRNQGIPLDQPAIQHPAVQSSEGQHPTVQSSEGQHVHKVGSRVKRTPAKSKAKPGIRNEVVNPNLLLAASRPQDGSPSQEYSSEGSSSMSLGVKRKAVLTHEISDSEESDSGFEKCGKQEHNSVKLSVETAMTKPSNHYFSSSSSSSTCLVNQDKEILVLSDEEYDDIVGSGFTKVKNLEPPLQCSTFQDTNVLPFSSEQEVGVTLAQTNSDNPSRPENLSVLGKHNEVMDICDDSEEDDAWPVIREQAESRLPVVRDDEDDDELPDLDIPLFKRLQQKGHTFSGIKTSNISSSVSQLKYLETNSQNSEQSSKVANSSKLNKQTSCSNVNSNCQQLAPEKLKQISVSSFAQKSSCVSTVNKKYTSAHGDPEVHKVATVGSSCDSRSAQNDRCAPIGLSDQMTTITKLTSTTTAAAATRPNYPSPLFTFLPGTFDIILCLDNREFYGSKGSSKTLLPDLMKSGITCDLRLLHVGDLLWVARERMQCSTDRGRELVLHHIIERKRLDDFVSSMTDGRLKEQKFRLKHCGLSEPIILIEEHGSIQNFSVSEDRIRQSIVNTQVIDGFKVKRCEGAAQVVSYLVTMTHFLSRHFMTRTLHAVSLDQLKELRGHQSMQAQEHHLVQFDEFNEGSVKQKDLTVSEMFAKQLIQIPGVSAERARAIINLYPTFSSLMLAYKNCTDDKARQKLLAGVKSGKKERNLGSVLSNIIYMLYTQQGNLS